MSNETKSDYLSDVYMKYLDCDNLTKKNILLVMLQYLFKGGLLSKKIDKLYPLLGGEYDITIMNGFVRNIAGYEGSFLEDIVKTEGTKYFELVQDTIVMIIGKDNIKYENVVYYYYGVCFCIFVNKILIDNNNDYLFTSRTGFVKSEKLGESDLIYGKVNLGVSSLFNTMVDFVTQAVENLS